MPVDAINIIKSAVPTTLPGHAQAFSPRATSLLGNVSPPAPAAVTVSYALPPAQQVALRVNETLPNITAAAATPTSSSAVSTALTAPSPELKPPPPVVQPILDRNPIAVPVYEIRNPNPAPADPKPIKKEILPPLPFGRVRPVDRLVLRREWEKRKDNSRRQEVPPRPSLAEVSIRQMVSRANEDLAANGLPLRLVLVKNNEGYSLDIYDCADDEVCRLTQEIHLDLHQLMTILDNLQHETGIIVNIMT